MNSKSLDESNRLLNVQQLAEYLNVPVGWVYKAAADGFIPSLKARKYRRFDLQKVLEALDKRENKDGLS